MWEMIAGEDDNRWAKDDGDSAESLRREVLNEQKEKIKGAPVSPRRLF